MTNKDIEQLINKYLNGETSPAEECQLARELQRTDIPEGWQAVRLMLGELTLGEAEYDAIMEHRPLQKEKQLKRKKFPLFRRGVGGGLAIAASIVMAFILWPNSPAVVEEPVEQQPVVAETVEQPDAEPSEASEASDYSESSVPAEPVKPKGTNKPRKVSKPAEEPLLAKAEPVAEPTDRDSRDHYEEKLSNLSNPYQLAVAQLQDLRSRGERLDREVVMLMQH